MLDDLSDKALRRDRPRFSVKVATGRSGPRLPFKYRAYQAGDESAIMQACNDTFDIDRDEHYWRWKFLHHGQSPMVHLALDSAGCVLAQMAAWPVDWYGNGRRIRVAQVGDLFARRHPAVVSNKVMLRTFAAFHHACSHHRQLLFGFPNGASAGLHGAGFSLLRGSQPVSTLRCALPDNCPGSSIVASPGWGELSVNLLESWPDETMANMLWQEAACRYRLATPRDGCWLRKRFMERPDVNDYRFIGCRDASGRLAAWAVTRPLDGSLWLCDLLWDGESPQTVQGLIGAAVEQAQLLCLRDIHCWLQGDAALTDLLLSLGWETYNDISQIRFAMYLYDHSLDATQLYGDLYLTRADSDLI